MDYGRLSILQIAKSWRKICIVVVSVERKETLSFLPNFKPALLFRVLASFPSGSNGRATYLGGRKELISHRAQLLVPPVKET